MNQITANSHENRIFFYILVISTLIAYSPLKPLALIYPWIFVFLFISTSRKHVVKNLLRIYVFLFVTCYVGLLYWILNRDFIVFNYALFLVTSSSFLVLLLDFSHVANKDLLIRFTRFLGYFCLIQACIALVQVVYTAYFVTGTFDRSAGDAAQGTLTLQLVGDDSGSNPMYAILQSSLLVFIASVNKHLTGKVPVFKLFVIFISWIFASVLHTIFFWMVAFFFTVFLFPGYRSLVDRFPNIRFLKYQTITISILAFGCLTAGLLFLQPKNMNLLVHLSEKTFTSDMKNATTKTRATVGTLRDLPKDKSFQPLIGLGFGQYCSRAGMIASGEYLSRSLPFGPSISPELEKHILVLWRQFKQEFGSGSSRFPFYSWLSLFGEVGVFGVLAILGCAGFLIYRLRKLSMQISPFIPMSLIFITVYLLLLGLQDNYWEFTQPLFIVVVLAKLCYEYSKQEARKVPQNHSAR